MARNSLLCADVPLRNYSLTSGHPKYPYKTLNIVFIDGWDDTVWATSSVRRLRTWCNARVWELKTFATFLAWQSNRKLESMVTPSDLSCGLTGRVLPATSTVVMLAADRSWAAVPRKTTSDLSALSCMPFCRNHRRIAAEQCVSLSMAGIASVLSMLTSSCVSSANWWYDTPYDLNLIYHLALSLLNLIIISSHSIDLPYYVVGKGKVNVDLYSASSWEPHL